MSGIVYVDAAGTWQRKPITRTVLIGSAPGLQATDTLDVLTLPSNEYLEARHAIITRQETTKMPVLIDLVGRDVRVNSAPILGIKVLRHNDRVHLGRTQLTYWEVRIIQLDTTSEYVNYVCPLCRVELRANDEVIVCPHVASALHRRCWFASPFCPVGSCEYPNHTVVMDTLSALHGASASGGRRTNVRFERSISESIDLVTKKLTCSAQRPIDQIPFKVGQNVAYCPDCEVPYHLKCWLDLPMCPKCGFNIQARLNELFKT